MSNQKSPLIPSLILIVTLLLAVFYLSPLIGEVNDQDVELATAQEENTKALEKLSALKAQKAQVDVLTMEEKNTLGQELPRDLKQDEVVHQIETILQTNSLTVKSMSFSQPAAVSAEVQKVTTTLNLILPTITANPTPTPETVTSSAELAKISTPALMGVKDTLLNVIKSFEQNPRLFSLKAITITYNQEGVVVTVSLDFYFQK